MPWRQVKQVKALGPDFPLTEALQDYKVILLLLQAKKHAGPGACD